MLQVTSVSKVASLFELLQLSRSLTFSSHCARPGVVAVGSAQEDAPKPSAPLLLDNVLWQSSAATHAFGVPLVDFGGKRLGQLELAGCGTQIMRSCWQRALLTHPFVAARPSISLFFCTSLVAPGITTQPFARDGWQQQRRPYISRRPPLPS